MINSGQSHQLLKPKQPQAYLNGENYSNDENELKNKPGLIYHFCRIYTVFDNYLLGLWPFYESKCRFSQGRGTR